MIKRPRTSTVMITLFGLISVYLLGVHIAERIWPEKLNGPLRSNQAEQIIKEIQEVRQLLVALRNNAGEAEDTGPLVVNVAGRPALGKKDAPLTMVEFTDYQCPFCAKFHKETFPLLKSRFVDKGLLRFVVMDLPLDNHRHAVLAAQAAHCAGDQGKYFDLSEAMYDRYNELNPKLIVDLAKGTGVDMARFDQCLESERYLEKVKTAMETARKLRLTGTPSFIIGKTTPNDQIEGIKVVGAHPFKTFKTGLNQMLEMESNSQEPNLMRTQVPEHV